MRYFRRPWDELRGDEHDAWGTSVWFLEIDDEGWIRRQVQVYDTGPTLTYDDTAPHDAYGELGDQQVDIDDDGYTPFIIDAATFDAAWRDARPLNR